MLFLVLFLIGLIFTVLPLHVRILADFSLADNIGNIKLKIFGITVFKKRTQILNTLINNTDSQNKAKPNKALKAYFAKVGLTALEYIAFPQVDFKSSIGYEESMLTTAMLVGSVNIVLSAIGAFLKNRGECSLEYDTASLPITDTLGFGINAKAKFTAAGIIAGLTIGTVKFFSERKSKLKAIQGENV